MLNRREFFRLMGGTVGAACGISLAPRWVLREAHAATLGRTLVTVFLRGGCDGLNCVVPYGDDDYHRMRPDIRIPAPGPGNTNAARDLNGFFGLHPALPKVSALYRQGRVAVLPAVHYRNAPRSHFESQALIERAGAGDGSGWLNRYLAADTNLNSLRGIALAERLPAAFNGPVPARVLNSLAGSALSQDLTEESLLKTGLAPHYAARAGDIEAMRLVRTAGRLALQDVDFLRTLRADEYRVASGAVYPVSGFGTHLRDAALLIKARVGLEAATVDLGGWDTHASQGNGAPEGRQARVLAELDSGLGAFLTDLGPQATQVVVLVMTEFGRSADQNASGGTDHGNASAAFVLGGAVRGGIYLGTRGWPGLARDRLRDGRDLMHTFEHRDVMAEILLRHLGLPVASLSAVLPGSAPAPIGLL